jgi:hypothetical protein
MKSHASAQSSECLVSAWWNGSVFRRNKGQETNSTNVLEVKAESVCALLAVRVSTPFNLSLTDDDQPTYCTEFNAPQDQ